MNNFDLITERGLDFFAVSAEAPADSRRMKERQQAPFLFIADQDLALIDHFGLRTMTFSSKLMKFKTISHPTFILFHRREEVWRDVQPKYKRTAVSETLAQIDSAMARITAAGGLKGQQELEQSEPITKTRRNE